MKLSCVPSNNLVLLGSFYVLLNGTGTSELPGTCSR